MTDQPALTSNRRALERLFETGAIRIARSPLFDTAPSPLPPDFSYAKVEGMMLGLAIGDSLGNTTESQLPGDRQQRYGEIRDYLPNRYADYKAVGLPSDDTQLAFWTLDQMLADGGFDPERVAGRYCRDRIYGIGGTVRGFIFNLKSGKPWYESGVASAGNGALMRIAPMVIPHLRTATSDLWVDTALAAMVTHNDAASISACLALVSMLWQLLAMQRPPEPQWWPQTYVEVAKELEGETKYRPRSAALEPYEGPVWRFVEKRLLEAPPDPSVSVQEACDRWHSGAYLLETVPSVIYILMRHGHDPEEAIVRAVNDTKDNDTVAAIVGAAVGALHGADALPRRWIDNLSGRTTDSDDGRVFDLLESARRKWWAAGPNSRLAPRPRNPMQTAAERFVADLASVEADAGTRLDDESIPFLATLRQAGILTVSDWYRVKEYLRCALDFLSEPEETVVEDDDSPICPDADPRSADWPKVIRAWRLSRHKLPTWAALWLWWLRIDSSDEFWQEVGWAAAEAGFEPFEQ